MDWIKALGIEYGFRAKMFDEFVGAFKKTAPSYFPSLSIEDKTDDTLNFRYLGRRLRIRHSFAVEDHPEIFERDNAQPSKMMLLTRSTPGETASTVRSELKLVVARNDPDDDGEPVASISIDGEGRIQSGVAWKIVDRPERAFRELLAVWLGPKKTDSP